jgi:hypothetical protein
MSNAAPPVAGPPPAVRSYTLVCLGALVLMLLALLHNGPSLWPLVPFVAGALGLVTSVRQAPLLLLLALVFVHLDPWTGPSRGWGLSSSVPLSDLLLCAAVLAYVGAHYRLQALTVQVIPRHPRRPLPRRQHGGSPVAAGRRSPQSVGAWEIPLFLVAVAGCVALAQLAWSILPDSWTDLRLPPHLWRTMLLSWGMIVGLLLGAAVIGHLGRRRMGADEAAMLLQDMIWRETRGEQRRVNRWLAWRRLRGRQREQRS